MPVYVSYPENYCSLNMDFEVAIAPVPTLASFWDEQPKHVLLKEQNPRGCSDNLLAKFACTSSVVNSLY